MDQSQSISKQDNDGDADTYSPGVVPGENGRLSQTSSSHDGSPSDASFRSLPTIASDPTPLPNSFQDSPSSASFRSLSITTSDLTYASSPNPSQNGSPSDASFRSLSIAASDQDDATISSNASGLYSVGTSLVDTFGANRSSWLASLSDLPIPIPAGEDKIRRLNVDDMIHRLLDVGYTGKVSKSLCLENVEIVAICQAAREIFLNQPTLIELSPPVKIVGDVHGQYSDLIRLFEMCGFPPSANYLFLGDYVDRGKQSLETILLLLCYKIKYPENFFLLRGNHECANVTRGAVRDLIPMSGSNTFVTVYGFYDECKRRCDIKTWKRFIDVFNCLPIVAIVASKIFCVHGGLSPSLYTMEDIKRIQRPTDVPDYGLLTDLLWSDPSDTALDWEENDRGVSYCFGKAVINDFLVRYDMDIICRAHMVVEDGYEFWNDRTLVTVFSAPNYSGGKLWSSLL